MIKEIIKLMTNSLKNAFHGKLQNLLHPNSEKWSELFQKAKDSFT